MANTSKRGLSWPREHPDAAHHLFTRPGSKVSWLYNWSPTPHLPGAIQSLGWAPMQWNLVDISSLESNINAYLKACPGASLPVPFLGFNEPERADQSCIPAAAAAAAWLTHIEPLRARGLIRAGSPGIASTEEGIAWLQEFTRLIRAGDGSGRTSDVDFWCLHWYGPADLGAFYDYIWSAHARVGNDRPVWITEFACTNWDAANPIPADRVAWFLGESVKYLDTLAWVERYAWFAPVRDPGGVGRHAALLDAEGAISELGKMYRDL